MTKARYITQIYGKDFPRVIDTRQSILEKDAEFKFRRDAEIRRIFAIFANLSLTLLPAYASDYPENNKDNSKNNYYKLILNWNKHKYQVVSVMTDNFCSSVENGLKGDAPDGGFSELQISQFISRGELHPEYFNVVGIRDLADSIHLSVQDAKETPTPKDGPSEANNHDQNQDKSQTPDINMPEL